MPACLYVSSLGTCCSLTTLKYTIHFFYLKSLRVWLLCHQEQNNYVHTAFLICIHIRVIYILLLTIYKLCNMYQDFM